MFRGTDHLQAHPLTYLWSSVLLMRDVWSQTHWEWYRGKKCRNHFLDHMCCSYGSSAQLLKLPGTELPRDAQNPLPGCWIPSISITKYRTASFPLASLLTFPISFFLSGLINALYFSPNRQRSPPSFLALLTSHHTVLISHNSKHPTALLVLPFRSWALWDPLAFSDSYSHLQPKPLAGDSQTCPGQRYAHLLL